ncbi:cysteine dioxygenase family protein [Roseomonas elaeocarpi]|uniref:Cysteine dioxygenase n=1 Tax=Roseomonas elaeocarpi TaxID=907779 RepID=A0ABV6JPH4_9PROT
MLIRPPRTTLDTLLAEVALAVRAPLAARPAAVAEAIGAHLHDAQLLIGRDLPGSAERYVRHLLHSDPAGGYAVVALVWRPGQMSPIHAHRTWCALGVHAGTLTESFFDVAHETAEPVTTATALRRPGALSHGGADPRCAHRLANLGCTEAVSIHCYGVGFERFGEGVNQVYAA